MSKRLMEKIWAEGVGASGEEVPVKPKFIQFLSKIGVQAAEGRVLIPLFEPEVSGNAKAKGATVISKGNFVKFGTQLLPEVVGQVVQEHQAAKKASSPGAKKGGKGAGKGQGQGETTPRGGNNNINKLPNVNSAGKSGAGAGTKQSNQDVTPRGGRSAPKQSNQDVVTEALSRAEMSCIKIGNAMGKQSWRSA